jgi:hypothetical protein
MINLSQQDLKDFKEAFHKDHGIELKEQELYKSAFGLIKFFEGLIKYDSQPKNKVKKVLKSYRKRS